MTDAVKREVDRRKARGYQPRTVKGMDRILAMIGYRMDRSSDCHGVNCYMTGDLAGESYPAVNAYVVEIDTGLSFAHVNSRKDGNFEALQRMRRNEELYAVVRGRILEV